jgi:hypothetical protein
VTYSAAKTASAAVSEPSHPPTKGVQAVWASAAPRAVGQAYPELPLFQTSKARPGQQPLKPMLVGIDISLMD